MSSSVNRAEIQAANERLRALLDFASDGIHLLYEDGNVIECSLSFARMLGDSYPEALSFNVADCDVQIPAEQQIPFIFDGLPPPRVQAGT